MKSCVTLKRRAEIIRKLRRFFDERGFTEVETPLAIAAPAPEPHIDCPKVVSSLPPGAGERQMRFLRASPELQMKKLLARGMDKIYQLGPCFREGERGRRHNPEFTMLEWYRRNADYRDIANDLKALLETLSFPSSLRGDASRRRGNLRFSPATPLSFTTLTVREAYREYARWDPFAGFDQDRFDYDMALKIEPAIKALGGGVFLTDYPPEAASLALIRGEVAERWEFYFDGMELANCFTELCNGDEQRRRFEASREARRRLGEADYPLDEEFLRDLDAIGSAAGVALGVDRLVMVLLGADEIADVRAGE